MRFLHGEHDRLIEATYADAFIVARENPDLSRLQVDTSPDDPLGMHFPVVVANMNAVAGRRMAEVTARRGGLTILPQDLTQARAAAAIRYVKGCDVLFETPVTVSRNTTISHVGHLMMKRAHDAALVMGGGEPIGIITSADCRDDTRLMTAGQLIKGKDMRVLEVEADTRPADMLRWFTDNGHHAAPVVANGEYRGLMTRESIVRSTLYQPAVDNAGRLMVGAAVGINGDPVKRAKGLVRAGADIIVIDTAHGHQLKTLRTIDAVSNAVDVPIVAGNVVTGSLEDGDLQATQALIKAGAHGVKVGIGPGAMCTTRLATGVGRPQFSTVYECATAARSLGAFVWADGGIRHPRDTALALAAGASSVVAGSLFASTNEAASEAVKGSDGRWYKENFGMASLRAVDARTFSDSELERARKAILEEGISTSRQYIDSDKPGVESKFDAICAGLRSAMTYSGAANLAEYYLNVIVGIQSAAGYSEGLPLPTSW